MPDRMTDLREGGIRKTGSPSPPFWRGSIVTTSKPPAGVLSLAARRLAAILDAAGIRIQGDRPWDIQVHDPRFFQRVLFHGSLGAGESYVDGWWDVDALDEFFARLLPLNPYRGVGPWGTLWLKLQGQLLNRQTRSRAGRVASLHYDLGNDLFQAMLDPHMQYTCAYWKGARNLDEAQENKLHLICRKLHLRPGMTVLDLGGGFGGLARFLATEYGCRVVSYNISRSQVAFARELCHGLPVRFEHKDYREAAGEPERFDRVTAIGLCEHVGYKNYAGLFDLVRDRLKDHGLFLLHTIGSNRFSTSTDAWFDRYIFPNGMMPSVTQLGQAIERGWVMEDWHNFGPDYDRTLLAWWANFDRAWPRLAPRFGQRFYRMWRYYLLASAGAFRARQLQLWQIVLSRGDIPAYTCVR